MSRHARVLVFVALLTVSTVANLGVEAAAGPISTTPFGGSTVTTDTIHENIVKYFNVTNSGGSLDYVIIPLGQMTISGPCGSGRALGVPSPEFGRSLAPGATGSMKVIVQVCGTSPPSSTMPPIGTASLAGTYTLMVPFQSQLTNTMQTVTITITVTQAGSGQQDIDTGVKPATHALNGDPAVQTYAVSDSIWTLAASADLSRLATAPQTHSGTGAFFGLAGGTTAWTVTFPAVSGIHADAANWQAQDDFVSISPDGKYAASMDWNGNLYLINDTTGSVIWSTDRTQDANTLYPPTSEFANGFYTSGATAFSPDGRVLAAGGSNGLVEAFSAPGGQLLWKMSTGAEVRGLRFTPDGRRLAVGSGDWHFYMVNATSGTTLWTGNDEFWPFFFIAMDRAGTLVGTGGKDSVFNLWDVASGRLKWSVNLFDTANAEYLPGNAGIFVTHAAISDDGHVVVSQWGSGVNYYDSSGNLLWHKKVLNPIATMTPDGQYVFVGDYVIGTPGNDLGPMYLLDNTGSVLWTYTPDNTKTCQTSISPFPRVQIMSVQLYESPDGGTLTAAASCVGGTVFSFHIPVKSLSGVTTTTTTSITTSTASVSRTLQTSSTTSPTTQNLRSSSTTNSATSSVVSTGSSSTSSTSGGIPEFPIQFVAVSASVVIIIASYLLIRIRPRRW